MHVDDDDKSDVNWPHIIRSDGRLTMQTMDKTKYIEQTTKRSEPL